MSRNIPVFALNIAATPHPEGVYIGLLTRASRYVVRAHGSDYANISKPKESERPGIYVGVIRVWTELKLDGRWYDTLANSDLADELKKTINIPQNAKPNYRTFDYAFTVRRHRLYFEARNEFGETVGPTTVRRVFEGLMSQEIQGIKAPNVEVTLIPREGEVKRILGMQGLRKLTMRVVLPNPDGTDGAVLRRVRKRLVDARAKQLEETYTKQAGVPRLVATQEITDTAIVAAENGFVQGEGVVDGQVVSISTANAPRREFIREDSGNSFLGRLIASIGLF